MKPARDAQMLRDPQAPIFAPTLFLIFISNIPDVISTQLDVYANDTHVYSCISSKTNRCDKANLATALEKELLVVIDWDKRWLLNFTQIIPFDKPVEMTESCHD